MIPFCDLSAVLAEERAGIDARLGRVLDHGHFINGPEVAELETALAQRLGVGHAIGVASGTTALELALRALGIGPGDEVITTAFTWIATANAIALVGATPVFVDIANDGTFLIDPAAIAAAVTPRTRAVLPVSLFGQMPDVAAIAAAAPGLPILEDAAQSFGATRQRCRSGNATTIAATSFFPTKPLACLGDGGAIFTNDNTLADRCRALRSHGGVVRHQHGLIGTNGRLDTLQAAVLLERLARFDHTLARRQAVAHAYLHGLHGLPGLPTVIPDATSAWAQFTLTLADTAQRERLIAACSAAHIGTAIYYPTPVHHQPSMAAWRRPLPVTEAACGRVLSLPFFTTMTEAQVARVVAVVREACGD
jgi:UDP-2-acetamido-2-deoxy-ribo-hexuluronate aminotransferase